MFSLEKVYLVARKLGVDFSKFSIEDLTRGVNIELEHGLINPSTNVTDDSIVKTMKIALAHLQEFPNYYNKDYGLLVFEESLKKKNS